MAQYFKHNFFDNYANSIKYKDSELERDIIEDELSKLCVFERRSIIAALASENIDVKANAKCSDIAKKLSQNLKTNQNLQKKINKLIILNNADKKFKEVLKKDKKLYNSVNTSLIDSYMNADGDNIINNATSHEENYNLLTTKPVSVWKIAGLVALSVSLLWIAGIIATRFFKGENADTNYNTGADAGQADVQSVSEPAPTQPNINEISTTPVVNTQSVNQ